MSLRRGLGRSYRQAWPAGLSFPRDTTPAIDLVSGGDFSFHALLVIGGDFRFTVITRSSDERMLGYW